MDSITVTPRWERRSPDLQTLRLGRIELAQLSRARSGEWFVTLWFTRDYDGPSVSCATESTARALAEAHARRVLGDV